MYSENLENLIELALADGVLTDKEKEILFKKAEAEGIDHDEFEMVLNGKLYEKTKGMSPGAVAAPKSDKYGDVKKCPSCGAMISTVSTRCQECGYEFQTVEASTSINKLFQMLNDAENSRTEASAGIFEKLQATFGVPDTDRKKLEIISSYPIPTTKNDMIEFLALALPKTKIKKYLGFLEDAHEIPKMYANTWKEKCEQIILKARFTMKDDRETLDQIEHYAKELGIK